MPERIQQLQQWLSEECGFTDVPLEPASGDASFRRYFRLRLADGSTRIVMDAPPQREGCEPFVAIGQALAAVGVHMPRYWRAIWRRVFCCSRTSGSALPG